MSASEVKEFVSKIDADGNGFISPEEFERQFKGSQNKFGINLTDEKIQEAMTAMDKDGDGMFSIKEVFDWMVDAGYMTKTEGLGMYSKLVATE